MTEIIMEYILIVLNTKIMYLLILFTLKMLGQKEIGDLNIQDFILVLLMAETTQHAMLGENETLGGGIVAFLTIFLSNKLVNWVFFRFQRLIRYIDRKPILLISKGKIN